MKKEPDRTLKRGKDFPLDKNTRDFLILSILPLKENPSEGMKKRGVGNKKGTDKSLLKMDKAERLF